LGAAHATRANWHQQPTAAAALGGGADLADRDGLDSLEDLRGNLVGIALRVGTAIFQIAPVVVLDEAVRHANRCATVGDAVAELVDRGSLVLAGQPHVIVGTVDRDVIFTV